MEYFRSHVLLCGGTGCTSSGSNQLMERLEARLKEHDLDREIKPIRTGCFGLCEAGPIVIVYPEGTFYSRVTTADIDEIVREHLLKGRPVTRLLYDETVNPDNTIKSLDETAFYKKQVRNILGRNEKVDPIRIYNYIENGGYAPFAKVLEKAAVEFDGALLTSADLRRMAQELRKGNDDNNSVGR